MITTTARTEAPPSRLWDAVADVTSWPRLLPTFDSVKPLDPGGTGVGSRFRVRQPGLAAATYDITEWQPGRAFTWVARSPGLTTTARHVVTADRDGSALTLSIDWSGAFAGLARTMLSGRAQRMIDAEAQALTAQAARLPQ